MIIKYQVFYRAYYQADYTGVLLLLFLACSLLFAVLCVLGPLSPVWGQNAGAGGVGVAARGSGNAHGAGNNTENYSLRPPPLSVPAGKPGAIRRSIMQFYNWTLICDAVLADKKQICNVSQAVWDSHNMMIFSWSLAASDKGEPFMLLRALPDTDIKTPVRIALKGTDKAVNIDFIGCNETVCMAQTPVGPFLKQAIGNESNITISYRTAGHGMLSFDTSLLGLKAAVASIK